MKKGIITALGSAIAIAIALPAAAAVTNEISGSFQVRGIVADLGFADYAGGKEYKVDTLVDQRFRAKWTSNLNDVVKVVYQGEVDFEWGDQSYSNGTRNEGGGLGGDAVNLENKSLYLELSKIPGAENFGVRAGLQPVADNLDSFLIANDMSALVAWGKNLGGKLDVTGVWGKIAEEPSNAAAGANAAGAANANDDIDLYGLMFGFKPAETAKVGLDLIWVRDLDGRSFQTQFAVPASTRDDLYYVSLNGSVKAGPATISGWLLYNFGTLANAAAGDDVKVSALGGTLKAALDIPTAGASAMARVMYFPGDKKADDKVKSIVEPFGNGEHLAFGGDGLMIFLGDGLQTNYPAGKYTPGVALCDAAYAGYGLTGIVLGGSITPKSMEKMYAKASLGYFTANNDTVNDGVTKREGKALGTEFAARVGYKVAEAIDLSLNGSMAWLGSFYDGTATGKNGAASDPNDPFIVYWNAKVVF